MDEALLPGYGLLDARTVARVREGRTVYGFSRRYRFRTATAETQYFELIPTRENDPHFPLRAKNLKQSAQMLRGPIGPRWRFRLSRRSSFAPGC